MYICVFQHEFSNTNCPTHVVQYEFSNTSYPTRFVSQRSGTDVQNLCLVVQKHWCYALLCKTTCTKYGFVMSNNFPTRVSQQFLNSFSTVFQHEFPNSFPTVFQHACSNTSQSINVRFDVCQQFSNSSQQFPNSFPTS